MEAVHRPRVLLVEEEALVRLDLALALSDAGFDAIEVANAEDALAVLSSTPEIKVMITEVNLAGSLDGAKLSWMARHKWPPLHIIVVSGQHRKEEMQLPERSLFFPKPYRARRLVNAVRELLNSERPTLAKA